MENGAGMQEIDILYSVLATSRKYPAMPRVQRHKTLELISSVPYASHKVFKRWNKINVETGFAHDDFQRLSPSHKRVALQRNTTRPY